MHRARCSLLFNATALPLGAAAVPNFFPCTRHNFLIYRGLKSRNLFIFPDFNQLASWRIRIIVYFWNEVPYRGLGAEKLSAGG